MGERQAVNTTLFTDPHVMLINFNGYMIDVNLKDMTSTYPTFTTIPAGAPMWGQWYKKGFLLCRDAASRRCDQYSMADGTW